MRAAWLDAADVAEQRRICAEMESQLWQDLPFVPMGEYWQTTAYRKELTGIIPGCFTVFWGSDAREPAAGSLSGFLSA